MGRKAKYYIKRAKDGQFYFILKATNGKTILQSEMYKSYQGAEVGIKSVQRNGDTKEIINETK